MCVCVVYMALRTTEVLSARCQDSVVCVNAGALIVSDIGDGSSQRKNTTSNPPPSKLKRRALNTALFGRQLFVSLKVIS